MTNQLGIYVHIPFCVQKCAYCDFYSLTGESDTRMDMYLKVLQTHMKETAAYTGDGWVVDTIYFGGGTPTLFGVKRLKALLAFIRKNWNVSKNCEITLEGNPDSIIYKQMKRLRRAGFNRISIGVQAMQNSLLESLQRAHNAEQAADSVRAAKKAGFMNISVDLLYGLPEQTPEQLEESLQSVLTWDVQHVSFYGLKLEEGTPLYTRRGELTFPDDDTQARHYLAAAGFLERNGFSQYEISNFAKQSRQSRHNMKYWNLEPYLGFGPSAHSDFSNKRYAYVRNIDEYMRGVLNGDAVVSEMEKIAQLERAAEYVMLGLRTTRGVSSNEYLRVYGVSFDVIEEKLIKYEKAGFARREGDRWRLTPEGFLLSNRILADLLETTDFSAKVL